VFHHEFNVYETLSKLDSLLEGDHGDPSPMDKAEYAVLTNKLTEGAAELLGHLAMHDVLALDTPDSYQTISAGDLSTATKDSDNGFPDEIVAIRLPAHLVPYGAIIEAMKTWNVGTVETIADLAILARLWLEYNAAERKSNVEAAILEQWRVRAKEVGEACLQSVQLLHAAGLLRVNDLATGQSYHVAIARFEDPTIQICIMAPPSGIRAEAARKKAPPRRRGG